jgi:sporulation protein YlmC with PRC-barrel domain
MSSTKPLIAASIAALLVFSPISAGAQEGSQAQQPQTPQQTQSPQATQQQQGRTDASGQTALRPGQLRISDWFDLELQTADGTEVGDLEDLIIENNRIVAAVVEAEGGGLGIGERRIAIPAERITRDGDRLVIDMTREELQALPEFRDSD